jgi:hypothetical protein
MQLRLAPFHRGAAPICGLRGSVRRNRARALGNRAHPAGVGIDAVDDRDAAAVGLAAPALDIDAHGRGLKDLDRPQRRPRRIPKRHMEPVPPPVLIGRNEWTEAEQRRCLATLGSDAAVSARDSCPRKSCVAAPSWCRALCPRVPDGCLRELCSAPFATLLNLHARWISAASRRGEEWFGRGFEPTSVGCGARSSGLVARCDCGRTFVRWVDASLQAS